MNSALKGPQRFTLVAAQLYKDFEIEPDAGSQNPYRIGVPEDTERRSFTLELVPEKFYTNAQNQVKLPAGRNMHSFFYRIYSPHEGVKLTVADLPKVSAYDAATNLPVACPKTMPNGEYLALPQFVVNVMSSFMKGEFTQKSGVIGSNAGVPAYLYLLKKMKKTDVAVVHFKAPTFFANRTGKGPFPAPESADVRYWSLCLQNFVKNETLSCLPDFLATPDAQGNVHLVVGGGEAAKRLALKHGFNYLADTRKSGQDVMGFVYRNVLPNSHFQSQSMYKGEYYPEADFCSLTDFLAEKCGF